MAIATGLRGYLTHGVIFSFLVFVVKIREIGR